MISPQTIYKSIVSQDGKLSIASEIEQRIKLITDAFPAAIAYVDENGYYQFVNGTYEKWLELDRARIIGKRPRDILNPCIWKVAQPHVDLALRGTPSRYELDYVAPSGNEMDLCITYQPGRSVTDDVQGYVVIIRNITEERKVNAALRTQERLQIQSKRRFESVADATGLGVWYSDLPNSAAVCSSQMREQFWLHESEAINLDTFLKRIHPDDHELVKRNVRASIENFQPYDVTYRIVNPHDASHVRWIHAMGWTDTDDRGRATRFDGITIDVTEKKALEQAIIVSEKRFRALADAAPVPIWSADQNKNSDWFNKAWLDYTGNSLASEIETNWKMIIHPEDMQNSAAVYRDAFTRRTEFELELRMRRRDGEYRWFLDHGVPRYSHENEFLGYIGTCIDIHERRNAELNLREAVRSRDEFLSIVSHELKTPLTSMKVA